MQGRDRVIQSDDSNLEQFGYKPQFHRVLGFFADFSIGYSYMSPLAGFYALFSYALATAGPAFFWTMPLVLLGHTVNALIFAEISSEYPIAGGVYQWSRRLVGERWGFLTGWMYFLALVGVAAGLAAGVAPYLAALIGIEATNTFDTCVALSIIILSAALNLIGTKVLGRMTELGVWAGLVGLAVCGGYMLCFARLQPFSVLFESFGAGEGHHTGAMLAASLLGIWIFFGHEACGDLAEEVHDASREVPRAMLTTMLAGGGSALLIALGMILAVPDMAGAVSGAVSNPADAALRAAIGPIGATAMLGCLMLVAFSATISVIASTSRLLFSMGRDRVIPFSVAMSRVNPRTGLPTAAVLAATVLPCMVLLVGGFAPHIAEAVISFATAGIYTTFTMVLIAGAFARFGGWVPSGPFRLGGFGWPLTVIALCFEVGALINLVWPRPASPDQSLVSVMLIPVVLLSVFCIGVVLAVRRPASLIGSSEGN
ncbi:MAG: amino acid permease [Acetobacter papayae]|uniref:amino acid permease n=1 Tax=Acetobacter papayae TaxID=1076592 RepID=UPI0039E78E38